MKKNSIKNVLIIGAGTMGQQISVPCSISGHNVIVYDNEPEALKKAKNGIKRIMDFFIKGKRISDDNADKALRNISFSSDLNECTSSIDFVSESVPEDPDLKGKIFSQLNDLCPEHAIFTTNTSTLLPSMFAQATGRPDRFAAFHFHDVRITNIVDIMPHPGTSKVTMEAIYEFASDIGQVPIVLSRESPGYVFNFMLSALFQAAQTLAANEVATVEDIDRAWMGVTHMMIGPFGIMDTVGIDTVWKITDYWACKLGNEQGIKNAAFMRAFVDRGELGQKSGKGFYSYPDPSYRDPDFISALYRDRK